MTPWLRSNTLTFSHNMWLSLKSLLAKCCCKYICNQISLFSSICHIGLKKKLADRLRLTLSDLQRIIRLSLPPLHSSTSAYPFKRSAHADVIVRLPAGPGVAISKSPQFQKSYMGKIQDVLEKSNINVFTVQIYLNELRLGDTYVIGGFH